MVMMLVASVVLSVGLSLSAAQRRSISFRSRVFQDALETSTILSVECWGLERTRGIFRAILYAHKLLGRVRHVLQRAYGWSI